MHIGVTEEIFATERLAPHKTGRMAGAVAPLSRRQHARRRHSCAEAIRRMLDESREHLLATLSEFTTIGWARFRRRWLERGWPLQVVLYVIGWHEGHHQGQAHLTYNLFKASRRERPIQARSPSEGCESRGWVARPRNEGRGERNLHALRSSGRATQSRSLGRDGFAL